VYRFPDGLTISPKTSAFASLPPVSAICEHGAGTPLNGHRLKRASPLPYQDKTLRKRNSSLSSRKVLLQLMRTVIVRGLLRAKGWMKHSTKSLGGQQLRIGER
jgi:hypothetical protein